MFLLSYTWTIFKCEEYIMYNTNYINYALAYLDVYSKNAAVINFLI